MDLDRHRLQDRTSLGSGEAGSRHREQMARYRAVLVALTGESVATALCLVRSGELVPV